MRYLLGLSGEPITSRVSPDFSGVGMIRGEYLCRRANAYVTDQRCQTAIQSYLERIAKLFAPDPVWYRFIDMETSEINTLYGADAIIEEKTTMLGLRGTRRGLRFPDCFRIEASLVAEVAASHCNVHALLPFVGDDCEFGTALEMLRDAGFANSVAAMIEVPSAVFSIRGIAAAGATSLTVGLNDLSSLTLGAYRGSVYHRLLHPSIVRLLQYARDEATACGLDIAVAGYLTDDVLDVIAAQGFETAILQYSLLPQALGPSFAGLPHAEDIDGIMRSVRNRVEERHVRLAVQKWRQRCAP